MTERSPREREQLLSALCSLWQSAYQAGHEDTVEARFHLVGPSEADEFMEVVKQWIDEHPEAFTDKEVQC